MESAIIQVLLVDDESFLLDVSKQFLELDPKVSVDTAISAVDALEMIEFKEYDAIVSDYQMPGQDGIQLLKAIRGKGNMIPFVLFTGKGREEVVIEALNAGADYYLQKGGDPRSQFAELENMIGKSVQKHRMEMHLMENEEKFKNIFDSANDSIHILDLDGRIIEINQIGCDWLGYTKQEMLEKNVRDIDSEESAEQVSEKMGEVVEKGFALFDTEWVTKHGERIPVEVSSRRIGYAGRVAILSVARDISERKRNEEALMENEVKFRTVTDFTYDWEYWLSPDGKIIYCSPSSERISGHTSEELSGDPSLLLVMVHPEDRSLIREHFEMESKAEPFELEFRIITKKGDTHWISHACQAVFDGRGTYLGRLVSNRDITFRKCAEDDQREITERARRRTEELEKLMDMVPAAIWVAHDPTCRKITGNQVANRFYEAIEGENVSAGPSGGDEWDRKRRFFRNGQELRPEALPMQEAASKGVEIQDHDLDVILPSGKRMTLLGGARPLLDAQGGVRGCIASFLDITERKRTEEALRESEGRFHELFNNIQSGIVVYEATSGGLDFVIKDINPYAEKIERVRKEDIVGRRVTEVFPGAEGMGIMEVFRSVWRNGGCERLPEALYADPDRPESWRENLVFKLPNGEVIAVYNNITKQKGVEEALLEARRKLDLLFSIIRLVINIQLISLEDNLDMLNRKLPDIASEELFRKAKAATERIFSMIQFAKEIENEGIQPPLWQDLRSLVEKGAKRVALGPIKLMNEIPAGLEIFANPLILNVFQDMMDNAVRYGENLKTIHFSIEEGGGVRSIICEDDGFDTSSEIKGIVFTPGNGMVHGLGLLLSCEILAITGITITEDGLPGRGAKFIIAIPPGGSRVREGQATIHQINGSKWDNNEDEHPIYQASSTRGSIK